VSDEQRHERGERPAVDGRRVKQRERAGHGERDRVGLVAGHRRYEAEPRGRAHELVRVVPDAHAHGERLPHGALDALEVRERREGSRGRPAIRQHDRALGREVGPQQQLDLVGREAELVGGGGKAFCACAGIERGMPEHERADPAGDLRAIGAATHQAPQRTEDALDPAGRRVERRVLGAIEQGAHRLAHGHGCEIDELLDPRHVIRTEQAACGDGAHHAPPTEASSGSSPWRRRT
jgi:hypothetical protein